METINWLQLRKLLIGKEMAPECCQKSYALGCETGKEYAELHCNHPGCCCVCGHRGTCPEDGPSHVEGIED